MSLSGVNVRIRSFFQLLLFGVVFLAIALFSSLAYSSEAYAENMEKDIRVACFKSGDIDANYSLPLHYSDASFFTQPSSVYNDDLAYASACLALASINASLTDWNKGQDNLSEFLTSMGCSEHLFNIGYTNRPTEKSNIGVGIGTKTITINEQEYKLFVIGVRGANYFEEWSLNLRVGNEGEHAGFSEARDTILSFILPYIREHTQSGDKVKIWCSGYSRAGATANLVGGWLNKWIYERNNGHTYQNSDYSSSYNAEHSVFGKAYNPQTMKNDEKDYFPVDYLDQSIQLSNDDIYFYPTCPGSGALKVESDQYSEIMKGIHNLVNPDDLTPLVAPTQWGFKRYGADHDITGTYPDNGSWSSREKSMLAFNQARIEQMLSRLKVINPSLAYSAPWFQQYYISHWFGISKDNRGEGNFYIDKNKSLNKNLGRYCLELLELVTDAGEVKTRQAYVSKLEESISYLMKLYYGLSTAQRNDLAKYLKQNLSAQIGASIEDKSFNIEKPGLSFLRFITDVLLANNNAKLNTILKNTLRASLAQASIAFDEYSVSKLSDDLSQFLNNLCKKDTKYLYHLTTIGKSISMITQAHIPEVNIAWWEASAGAIPDPDSEEKKHVKFHSKPYGQAGAEDSIILELNIPKGQERMISSDPAPKDDQGQTIDTGVLYYRAPQAAGYSLSGWEPNLSQAEFDGYYYHSSEKITYSKLPDAAEIDLYPVMEDQAIYGVEYHSNIPGNDQSETHYYLSDQNKINLDDNYYERPDYRFVGWNTKANGSGITYQPYADVDVSNLGMMSEGEYRSALGTDMDNEGVDELVEQNTKPLYAQWQRTTAPEAPIIQAQPTGTSWIKGDATKRTFSLKAYSPDGGTLAYQWYEDGQAIAGATQNTFTLAHPENREPGTYRFFCVVTNTIDGISSATTSLNATVIVKAPAQAPVITTQPSNLTWTKGDKTSRWLEVSAYSTDDGFITYQWYENGTAIKGATSNTYTIPNPEKHSAGKSVYYCVITNSLGTSKKSISSKKVTVTIKNKVPANTFVPLLKIASLKANSLKFTWNKNAKAQGYDIFLGKISNVNKAVKYKKIKTIKGNKTVSFTKTKLGKQAAYSAYVKAYKVVKGKKVYLPATPAVVAFTSNGNKTYTNAKAVVISKSSVGLSKGKSFQIKPAVKLAISKRKVLTTKYVPLMRYYSNNSAIAKVSKTGKITAVEEGTCSVYAVASNGVVKTLKVTVK